MSAKATFTHQDGLGVIALDSPPLNLLSLDLISDLDAAVAEAQRTDEMRALLLRGEGQVFSAGADVKLFAGNGTAEMRPLIESFLDLGRRIEALPVPTVAAVHGTCMAGGFELALFCDLIWAATGTMIGLPEIRLGIVPLAGGIQRVAQRAGLARARSIAFTGRLSSAERWAQWGVVDELAEPSELRGAAEGFARSLAQGPTRAFASAKAVARSYADGGLGPADAEQARSAVDLFDTADAQHGIAHFLEHGNTETEFAGA